MVFASRNLISWACCGFGARFGVLLLLVDDAAGPLVLAAALVAEDAAAEVAWLGWDEEEEEWVLLSMALGWCRGHHRGSFAMVPTYFCKSDDNTLPHLCTHTYQYVGEYL